jgi:hypothetical protein
MTKLLNVDGPPGCGKTYTLTNYFIEAAKRVGPRKVAAITFTRSAAKEMQERVGIALGIGKDPNTLKREIPWVRTIHSTAYGLIDKPEVVDRKRLGEFCKLVGQPTPGYVSGVEEIDAFDSDDGEEKNPITIMRAAVSGAKHRKCSIREVLFDLIPPGQATVFRPNMIELLAARYDQWKRESGLVDYDDMLEAGQHLTIPGVQVLIVDEAQDCSPLMWDVVNAWGKTCKVLVTGGDPFQSLYAFSGGNPQLFMGRPGDWKRLLMSRRVSTGTAVYARKVLEAAGWKDLQNLWEGMGGEPVDGTTMHIARTNALVWEIHRRLMEEGTPFDVLRGFGPWASPSAKAYRLIRSLRRGEMVQSADLVALVAGASFAGLPRGAKAMAETEANRRRMLDRDQVEALLKISLDRYAYRQPDVATYLDKVVEKHGETALLLKPKTLVGTIHCSPPDELILTANRGWVPIAELDENGDRLVSYHWQRVLGMRLTDVDVVGRRVGRRTGYQFSVTRRSYRGELITITTEYSKTRVTPNHLVKVYYAPDAEDWYVVYLMKKGSWWRIGQTRMKRVDGEHTWGLTRRLGNEMADDAWVLGAYRSREEALFNEARLAAIFGIPDTNFMAYPGRVSERLSSDDKARIYDEAAPEIENRAYSLLASLRLDPTLPFYRRNSGGLRSDKRGFDLHAANLIPGLLVVAPILDGREVSKKDFSISRETYAGDVYDLEVLPHHYYFSGGLLVHNSAKGREADVVYLARDWGNLPSKNASTPGNPAKIEACTAYVGVTRHRSELHLVDLGKTMVYPFPRNEKE